MEEQMCMARTVDMYSTAKIEEAPSDLLTATEYFGDMLVLKFKYTWRKLPVIDSRGVAQKFQTTYRNYFRVGWQVYFLDYICLRVTHSDRWDLEVCARCFVTKSDRIVTLLYDKFDIKDKVLPMKRSLSSIEQINKRYHSVYSPMNVYTEPIIISIDIYIQRSKIKSLSRMSEDFEAFYNDKSMCDVTFVVGDKKIQAHKAILMARNTVFSSMFRTHMKERTGTTITVDDTDPVIFEQLVFYLYTGRLRVITNWEGLLIQADKYCVTDLKEICENKLTGTLSIDNVADTLAFADFYNAEHLKNRCLDFVFRNKDLVTRTDGFKKLKKTHVHLIIEMFQKIDIYTF